MSIEELRAMFLRLSAGGDDHTSRQLALLLCLREGPGTVRDLAARMGVGKPVVSRGVDRLVEDLYAERTADPGDRRSVLAKLTARGRKFVDDMVAKP